MAKATRIAKIGRKRRAAGWTLLTLGVIVAGVWVASGWWGWGYTSQRGTSVVVAFGAVREVRYRTAADAGHTGWIARRLPKPRFVWSVRRDGWEWEYDIGIAAWENYTGVGSLGSSFLVLWPIPLLLWTPAALLLRSGILARRRAITGACAKCGYSLAGLADGAPCPECGKRTSPLSTQDSSLKTPS